MKPAVNMNEDIRFEKQRSELTTHDRLALIGLIEEGMKAGASECPAMADLFDHLWDLVKHTVSGAKTDRLTPDGPHNGFRVIEINAETGENIGRLNMIYLNKPIPCYYLVYVEVAPPFRKRGLGNRIIEHFRDFLAEKGAVGILDNIIPPEDPTYDIYLKQAWEPMDSVIGAQQGQTANGYMIYVPPKLRNRDLGEAVVKLIHHLKRRRAAIDMRDNEIMVRRTIKEFRDLYDALLIYFKEQIAKREAPPIMRFMFTRFVTKLISFRRRIGDLLGYTGGESVEQIELSPGIAGLPMKSYAPRELPNGEVLVSGEQCIWSALPKGLQESPARFIESLQNYRRPSLTAWLKQHNRVGTYRITIGDLMDIGFDPTRLKEISIDGRDFIFERMQARQVLEMERKRAVLLRLAPAMTGLKAGATAVRINPPLLIVRDRGNAYILRQKVPAIHWDEALEQIHTTPALKAVNQALSIDRTIKAAISRTQQIICSSLMDNENFSPEDFAYFVSWDIGKNRPGVVIDFDATYLESVWVA